MTEPAALLTSMPSVEPHRTERRWLEVDAAAPRSLLGPAEPAPGRLRADALSACRAGAKCRQWLVARLELGEERVDVAPGLTQAASAQTERGSVGRARPARPIAALDLRQREADSFARRECPRLDDLRFHRGCIAPPEPNARTNHEIRGRPREPRLRRTATAQSHRIRRPCVAKCKARASPCGGAQPAPRPPRTYASCVVGDASGATAPRLRAGRVSRDLGHLASGMFAVCFVTQLAAPSPRRAAAEA